MLKDCLSEEVMSTLMTFINGCQEEHHVLEQLTFARPLSNIVDTFDDDIIDNFTGIPVYQNDPLIYNKSLILKFNLDSFQHLNASNNVM